MPKKTCNPELAPLSSAINTSLTPGQHRVLVFIRKYINAVGYAPSLAEIATGLGISSRGAIHRQVKALAAAACIELVPGRKRGIRLPPQHDKQYSLPLLGKIAAGQPIEAIPGNDLLNVAEFVIGEGRYALRVSGDSMINAGILDGDTVIVRQQDYASSGDIVVALIDQQEVTLKRLKLHRHKMLELCPENPAMTALMYSAERVTIQGVVVSQLRSYQ